jgi:hypothetical protein
MQTRWLSAAIIAAANSRRSIASPRYNGPILLRGGSWGGISTGAAAGLEFGYIESTAATPGNGVGFILENNVPIATSRAYTPFNIHRIQNDVNSVVEGFPEFGGNTGPTNWRPLHFVVPKSGGHIVIAVYNGTGGGITTGINLEIIEEIPQAFLDCLKHLVM